MSLPNPYKVNSLAHLVQALQEANRRADEAEASRDHWHRMYRELQSEHVAVCFASNALCASCCEIEANTPEGKTFQKCEDCPKVDKRAILADSLTEALYWRDQYDQLFKKYQHDTRGSYDTVH